MRVTGSHHVFKKPGVREIVTVPHPKKDMGVGLVKSIYRVAGWQRD
jgi:predicted RNA binding protein YcfA (HicA-like mRNA interferase family)